MLVADFVISPIPPDKIGNEVRRVRWAEEFGRIRLSDNFFMRDFLHSEVANVLGLPNLPDDPSLCILAGRGLCENLLEPLQQTFGRIAVRSAYRSPSVNELGSRLRLGCASNERNYGAHIWDRRDNRGEIGAMATIVVPWFANRLNEGADWRSMAWFIHDHLPYCTMTFYPKLGAFNLGWSSSPKRQISSYVAPRGVLTRKGMPNAVEHHLGWYKDFPETVAAVG